MWLTITSAMTSVRAASARDVVPGAEPWIDLRVVDRIEAGVGAVDRMEERQHVHAAEDARRADRRAGAGGRGTCRREGDRRRRSAAPDSSCAARTRNVRHVGRSARLFNAAMPPRLTRRGSRRGVAGDLAPTWFANLAMLAAGQPDSDAVEKAAANASPAPTGSATSTPERRRRG